MIVNRELKFRVWDKLEKRFIYPDKAYQGHYVLTLGGEFYNSQNGSGGNDCIVLQYTGITDKNGKEIYEGDRIVGSGGQFQVKSLEINKYSTDQVCDGYVCYFKGCFFLGYYPLFDYDEFKIIGNTFETPESL